jgi:UDPglucose--hexose-1-phosphate uridylyltransferase
VSEVRHHPITGEPLVFAPERAARGGAFAGNPSNARCPFCPGHEADTPPEIARIGDLWRVRVFPNKYPPLDGAEVIVESPHHDASFDAVDDPREIVQLYVDRVRAHDAAAYVQLFKNEGMLAGSSIPHLHSQLVPAPFVPPRIAREIAGFGAAKSCPLCDAREFLLIDETKTFLALSPLAASFAYQQWLVPKRHVANVTLLNESEREDLASLLQRGARIVRRLSDSYNWLFLGFPRDSGAHFYVDLFPRLTMLAGFELGTGTFVEIIDPALAVERLRS